MAQEPGQDPLAQVHRGVDRRVLRLGEHPHPVRPHRRADRRHHLAHHRLYLGHGHPPISTDVASELPLSPAAGELSVHRDHPAEGSRHISASEE
jgi:hypothetical protein